MARATLLRQYRTSLRILALLVGVHAVIDTQRRRADLDEALGILSGPAMLHLTIFAQLRFREIVGRVDTHRLE